MGLYAATEAVTLACLLLGVSLGSSCAAWLSPASANGALIGLGCAYLVVLGTLWIARREPGKEDGTREIPGCLRPLRPQKERRVVRRPIA